MNEQEFIRLVDKYLEGRATPEEEALLLDHYQQLQEQDAWDEKLMGDPQATGTAIWAGLQVSLQQPQAAPVVPLYRRRWLQAVAAVLAIFIGGAAWWMTANQSPQPALTMRQAPAAGKLDRRMNQVVLSLGDGTSIAINSATNGVLVRQGNMVVKKQGLKIIYEAMPGKPESGAVPVHELQTSRGAAFQVVLPDGSQVWLNAASSLRYPARFIEARRPVALDGEAYFEVARRSRQPFEVELVTPARPFTGAKVAVLGTHFNLNAYREAKDMRATLLEGRVQVKGAKQQNKGAVLRPGQQALVGAAKEVAVRQVDVDREVAWQKGMFHFAGADTREVMQELARWYDVEVAYQEGRNQNRFSGKFSRSMALADVLRILTLSGVKLQVEGKKITVLS